MEMKAHRESGDKIIIYAGSGSDALLIYIETGNVDESQEISRNLLIQCTLNFAEQLMIIYKLY